MQVQNGPEIRSLANVTAGSTIRSGHLYIPCSSSQEARIKTKEIYQGTWKASSLHASHAIQLFLADL